MKILFVQWDSIAQKDLEEAFLQEGHELLYEKITSEQFSYSNPEEIERKLSGTVSKEKPDLVFSVNYSPAITEFCSKKRLRYVSWIYDSPYDWMYLESILAPCNQVYMLDKELCQEFRSAGIRTVQYLPMAANTERLDRAADENVSYVYGVSFVGALYMEADRFSGKKSALTDYTKGYMDALAESQMKIAGYNFIPEVLGPILDELCKVYPRYPIKGDLRTNAYFCAESVVNPWITRLERVDLLEAVAKTYGVDLFTHNQVFSLPNVCNHGPVDYYEEMPGVFRQSKINLNISKRGMRSAVPLRCFDIMGSGGFLLSNFQSGFLDLFVPGEDFVYYENKEDLLQKVGYYLPHEQERQEITRRGHDKVAANHTYRHRVRQMLDF